MLETNIHFSKILSKTPIYVALFFKTCSFHYLKNFLLFKFILWIFVWFQVNRLYNTFDLWLLFSMTNQMHSSVHINQLESNEMNECYKSWIGWIFNWRLQSNCLWNPKWSLHYLSLHSKSKSRRKTWNGGLVLGTYYTYNLLLWSN